MAGSVSISFHGIVVRASSRLTRRATGLSITSVFLAFFLLSKQVLVQTASQAAGASADPGRDATRSARGGSHLPERARVARQAPWSTGAQDPAKTSDGHPQCTLRAPFIYKADVQRKKLLAILRTVTAER